MRSRCYMLTFHRPLMLKTSPHTETNTCRSAVRLALHCLTGTGEYPDSSASSLLGFLADDRGVLGKSRACAVLLL